MADHRPGFASEQAPQQILYHRLRQLLLLDQRPVQDRAAVSADAADGALLLKAVDDRLHGGIAKVAILCEFAVQVRSDDFLVTPDQTHHIEFEVGQVHVDLRLSVLGKYRCISTFVNISIEKSYP